MEMDLPNTKQIQHLSTELLVRIFTQLDYGERIGLESVSPTWCTLAKAYAWKDQRILRISREMPQNSQQNELAPSLEAIISRCAPFLNELHLLGDFDMQMRFGRIFSQYPFGRLAHLHISAQLEVWHLRTIQRHLAPQLLSLAVVPTKKAMVAFQQLLANCNKLENLHIASNHSYHNLFDGRIEESESGQPSSSLALTTTTTSCCSFMPSTLKYLLIHQSHWGADAEKLVNALLSLLAHCSQLRYMPILFNAQLIDENILQLIKEKNSREFEKIIRLQFPFFIAKGYSFPLIQRPKFRSLKALHVDFQIGTEEICQIVKCCPQLEHLGIVLHYWGGNHIMEVQDLVVLHQFKRLSSLEIFVDFEMLCPYGEENIAFLEILTELDKIHTLRSLDLKVLDDWGYPSLSEEYLLQMSNQLKHLETFSCGFYLKIGDIDIDDMTGIGQFCEHLEQIFDSQEGANKKSFKFRLVTNGCDWDNYRSSDTKNLFVEWQKGSEMNKMNWHCRPPIWREGTWHRHRDVEPARSIVLNELNTSELGQRTSPPRVARIIIRGETIDESRPINHHENCRPQSLESYLAKVADLDQRTKIVECSGELKSVWREGLKNVQTWDVRLDRSSDDERIAIHYPTWQNVRRSFFRRRQLSQGNTDPKDPFDLPERLQMSKIGAIKLALGKPLSENDMWLLYTNRKQGLMLFATRTQIEAAGQIQIMVADKNSILEYWKI